MSNVIDNETGRPLADGKITHFVQWGGHKIGLVSYFHYSQIHLLPFIFIFRLGWLRENGWTR